MTPTAGRRTVHGFARFLLELLERERLRHIATAFEWRRSISLPATRHPQCCAKLPAGADDSASLPTARPSQAIGLHTLAHHANVPPTDRQAMPTAVRGEGSAASSPADKDPSQPLRTRRTIYDPGRGQRWGRDGS